MSNTLIITYSQLHIPASNYTKIQDFKSKLGIMKNKSGDGNVNANAKSQCKVAGDIGPLLLEVKEASVSKQNPLRLEYYTWLAAKLAEEGRLADFAQLASFLKEAGANVSNFVQELQMEVVCAGFSRQMENGQFYLVLETLSTFHRAGCHSPKFVDKNGIQLIGNECRKLAHEGNMEECIRALESLSDCLFPIKDFVEPIFIIQQCVKLREVRLALRYASLLPPPHVWFNFLIREFGKQCDLMSALIVFRRSQKVSMSPDMYSYRDIIDACGLCGNPEQARLIFKELLNQKVTPNAFVYNSIMNVNAGNLDYVLEIYKDMQNSGVTADVTTYNILLKIWCIAGKVDLAEHCYREIQSKAAAGDLKMDVITYSTMIQAFGKAKMWALAIEVKRDMIAAGITPDIVTWTSLIGACANAGVVEKAIQVFDEMILSGCEPNTQCCNTVLHACVKSCQYARAFQLFNTWKKIGFNEATAERHKDYVLETETEISLDASKLRSKNSTNTIQESSAVVHNQVSKTSQFKPTVVTYNILMKACGSCPYFVKSLMEEMEMLGFVPDRVSWSTLINAYGNAKDLRGVFQTLSDMRKACFKPDVVTYTAAIKACVKNKSPEKAFLVFETMKKSHLQPNVVTYNTLLRARRNYGNLAEVQQSLAVYEEMRKAGYASNDSVLRGILEEWTEGVIQHNNYRNHDQLFKEKLIWKEKENTRQVISYAGLFQKIAAHARPDNTNNLIRVDGLTKTEARIAVLAVLRILRERHGIGNPIKDDLTIVTGIGNTQDSLYDAIAIVLQDELGLVVYGDRDIPDQRRRVTSDGVCETKNHQTNNNRIPSHQDSIMSREVSIRRPPNLASLRISSKSLNQWLRKNGR